MLKLVKHPLIEIKLSKLREKKTKIDEFRKNLNQISSLMAYEVLKKYKAKRYQSKSVLDEKFKGKKLNKDILFVPILRAGLGMLDGFLEIASEARVGFYGLSRDEKTLKPVCYLNKVPTLDPETFVVIIDPMLATGNSAIYVIDEMKKMGYKNISFVSLLTVQETLDKLQDLYPDIDIYTASIDRELTSNGFISPGLGDAGDKFFGT